MTTNTPTPIDPKFLVDFDARTYQVTPHKEADLADDYEHYTAFVLFDDFVTQFFVPSTDFIQLTLRFRAILAVAYATAEASIGLNYGVLPSHNEYLAAVALFNEGLANRTIKLRDKGTRPETEEQPTSTDLSDTASLAEIVKAINELRHSSRRPSGRQSAGLVKRVMNWLATERQPGAHA
ncbi:MAG: hypothetical protein WBP12_05965 [Candidatus Saccharimonas sp.]